MLKDELDKFADKYDQFKAHYVLSSPPEEWQGDKGRINKNMIEERLPGPAGMASKVDLTYDGEYGVRIIRTRF